MSECWGHALQPSFFGKPNRAPHKSIWECASSWEIYGNLCHPAPLSWFCVDTYISIHDHTGQSASLVKSACLGQPCHAVAAVWRRLETQMCRTETLSGFPQLQALQIWQCKEPITKKMSESSLHEWLWYTLGRTLGASHRAVAWIGSASVTWLPDCCRAEFP